MNKATEELTAAYDRRMRTLKYMGDLMDNDGRLPDGITVWAAFGNAYSNDTPPTYGQPNWGWYQVRILGQADTHWWFVFGGYDYLPSFCLRHFSELQPVILAD